MEIKKKILVQVDDIVKIHGKNLSQIKIEQNLIK